MARTADRYLKKAVPAKKILKKYDVGNYLRLTVIIQEVTLWKIKEGWRMSL